VIGGCEGLMLGWACESFALKACFSCWRVLGHLWNALKGWDTSFILHVYSFFIIVSLLRFVCEVLAVYSTYDMWCAICISANRL